MNVKVSFIGEATGKQMPFKCIAKNDYGYRCCAGTTFDLGPNQISCTCCGSTYPLLDQFIYTENEN